MKPPQTTKDIQKLTGRIATLNRFIAKLVERSLPFFTVLGAQQEAYEDLKSYLQLLPTLSSPEQG
jgi:hypothetical protein